MIDAFRDFMTDTEPIRFREPLAETLGAFKEENAVLEYGFTDAVKMAGHACPTVTGTYLICQAALDKLYPESIPVRGDIQVTVYGEEDEGVYGVMGQVLSFLTGAAPQTGFKGLGPKFRRKGLLIYQSDKIDSEALCFRFNRLDNNHSVLVKFFPQRIPFPVSKGARLQELLEKVLWEAAKPAEKKEMQDLWMEKVRLMLVDKKDISRWLTIEERSI